MVVWFDRGFIVMSSVYLGLGSNLGDTRHHCEHAIRQLQRHPDIDLIAHSDFFWTEPSGFSEQPWFTNATVRIDTALTPGDLLLVCQSIENHQGRSRIIRWGPRTIDIDILLYDDLILISKALEIPHPRMHERRFVLEPLVEIAQGVKHPVYQTPIEMLFRNLRDPLRVSRCFPEPEEALTR